MFHGFTSHCNEFWISFYNKHPRLSTVNGYEIRWKRVTIKGVPVEAIEPNKLRNGILKYDEIVKTQKASFGIDAQYTLDNVRLYLQYCMLDGPLEEMELPVHTMHKSILDKLTSVMLKHEQFSEMVEEICEDDDQY